MEKENKLSIWEQMKKEKADKRKENGIIKEEVSFMIGSTIEECYDFMTKTKFSKERLNKEYFIVFGDFNQTMIDTEMSLEEVYEAITGLTQDKFLDKYKIF